MELGDKAQRKIKGTSVAIVGLGGLGSATGFYLTAAGIGKLFLVDRDRVELSNLNRQILHSENDLGRKKVESAAEKLRGLNSEVEIEKFGQDLANENLNILEETSMVVGAVDNFETRYKLNSFCIQKNIPFIHGGIEGTEGQITTIIPGKTPCLRCIFPEPVGEEKVFSALGTTAGVLGTLLANESLKIATGRGEPLAGELLFCDLFQNHFDLLSVEKDENCPVCGGS